MPPSRLLLCPAQAAILIASQRVSLLARVLAPRKQYSMPQLSGIHHVTAIASDPQENVNFYAGLLGLRLVKRTVNFDDPQSYHLYYGDGAGNPGTLLTFFAWPSGRRGKPGLGQVTGTALAVGPGALPFWAERFQAHSVSSEAETRFGEPMLVVADPDGLRLELVETPSDIRRGWPEGHIAAEYAVKGVHSVTLPEQSVGATVALLTETLGFKAAATEGTVTRYVSGVNPATFADVIFAPNSVPGQIAVGSVHHVAWRTPNDAEQGDWLRELGALRYGVSPVMDRDYFHSIYFREPGGILFEIATDPPGFATDETLEALGHTLQLPAQYEPMRAQLESRLPPLRVPKVDR